jgi:hypothetical protein
MLVGVLALSTLSVFIPTSRILSEPEMTYGWRHLGLSPDQVSCSDTGRLP